MFSARNSFRRGNFVERRSFSSSVSSTKEKEISPVNQNKAVLPTRLSPDSFLGKVWNDSKKEVQSMEELFQYDFGDARKGWITLQQKLSAKPLEKKILYGLGKFNEK